MWMTRELVTIEPPTPITEAAALMAKRRIRWLPVVEPHAQGTRLAGMISATDILHAFPSDVNPFAVIAPDRDKLPVTTEDIMQRQPLVVPPDTPIEVAAALMRERKTGALPVIRSETLVGLITESDIFRAFVSFFGAAEGGARITFDVSKGEDVFGMIGKATQKRGLRVVSLIASEQDHQPVCVVRVTGGAVDKLLDDIWNSGHQVVNVLRFT